MASNLKEVGIAFFFFFSFELFPFIYWTFPGGSDGKESAWSAGNMGLMSQEDCLEKGMTTHSSILVWRIPWTESLAGCSPWSQKELDMTERLLLSFFFFELSLFFFICYLLWTTQFLRIFFLWQHFVREIFNRTEKSKNLQRSLRCLPLHISLFIRESTIFLETFLSKW